MIRNAPLLICAKSPRCFSHRHTHTHTHTHELGFKEPRPQQGNTWLEKLLKKEHGDQDREGFWRTLHRSQGEAEPENQGCGLRLCWKVAGRISGHHHHPLPLLVGPSGDRLPLRPGTVPWGRGWFQGPRRPFIHCPQF